MRKLISLITLLSFSVQAATITDDKLTVGKKASASAKEIVFDTNDGAANKKLSVDKVTKKLSATSDEVIVGDGTQSDKALTFNRGGSNAQVKWNELTDKLQFSNDGTTFKDLGTGGGGGGSTGVNVLTNDSFEDAVGGVLTDWSNTGGTLTQQTYTNSVEGDAKYFQFVATGAGQYFEMVKTVPTNFNGQGCQVDFKKMNIATADLFKVEALDASNNVLATGNVKVSSWQKFPTLSFACPSAGSTFKIRVTSLAAGTLQGDKAYLGSNQNLVNTIVSYDYDWTSYTPTFTGFGAAVVSGAGCFHKRKGGDLHLACQFTAGTQTATEARVSLPNSLITLNNFTGVQKIGDWTANYSEAYSGHLLIDPNVGYVTFAKQGSGSSGLGKLAGTSLGAASSTYAIRAIVPISGWTEIKQQDIAVNTDQASWFIDANIGGANATLTTIRSSYTEITGSSWDMVVNTNKGSAPAEIPCQSTTASTGLTCSGVDESMGVVFTPPNAGNFEVCVYGAMSLGSGGNGIFQLIETPNNAQTILQEGGAKINIQAASTSLESNISHCSDFVFNSTSKRTIRLMHEKNNTVALIPLTDRDANSGQRDFRFTVRPLLSAYNRPILTGDQVTTKGVTNPEVFSFSFAANSSLNSDCSSGSCYVDQIGNLVNSFNFVSTGTYNLNVSKTYSKLKCSPSYTSSTNQAFPQSINSCSNCNTLTMVAVQRAAGTVGNVFGTVICHGIP